MEMECASEERIEERADPFSDVKVIKENTHDCMVVLMVEEEEDGTIFTTDALSGRAVEEGEFDETKIDSRLKTPDKRKNNGRESLSSVKVMDVKETEMEEIEITNTPEDGSEIDDTDLLTESWVGPVSIID